jgi:hypothetical protein
LEIPAPEAAVRIGRCIAEHMLANPGWVQQAQQQAHRSCIALEIMAQVGRRAIRSGK